MIGDNVGNLYEDATKLLTSAEKAAATYFRIAYSGEYKPGARQLAELRYHEYKAEADTLRRLIEYAFAA